MGKDGLKQRWADVAARLDWMQEQFSALEKKVNYSETQSRCSNVRTDSLSKQKGKTWKQTEEHCKTLFPHSFGLSNLTIEQAHCTGPKRNDKPCSIVIKFLPFRDREAILVWAKDCWSSGINVNPDFSSQELNSKLSRWEHREMMLISASTNSASGRRLVRELVQSATQVGMPLPIGDIMIQFFWLPLMVAICTPQW